MKLARLYEQLSKFKVAYTRRRSADAGLCLCFECLQSAIQVYEQVLDVEPLAVEASIALARVCSIFAVLAILSFHGLSFSWVPISKQRVPHTRARKSLVIAETTHVTWACCCVLTTVL
jgi:hypothetical protein